MIRRVEPHEAGPLRELRLRALQDAPYAFAGTVDQARALPPEQWEEWAASPIFVAVDGDPWRGMVAARSRDGSAWLSALWVEPAARGTGLGERLIGAVVGWAREQGLPAVELSVTTNNAPAAALYARCGFAETGRRRPLPADPSRTEVFLRRPL